MRQILTMTAYDLRQRVRDKSVFIFAIGVPLALMYVFNLVFGGLSDLDLKPVTVAVSAPAGDQLAAVVPQVLGEVEGVPVTVREVQPQDVKALVESGEAGIGIVLPPGFGADQMAGKGPEVTVTLGDEVGLEGTIVTSILQGTLDQLNAGTQAARAAATLGASPVDLAAIAQSAATAGPAISLLPGQTASEQLGPEASVVAGQAGMFLLFTVGFGALGLVIEREWGTLARLLSMPMRPWYVVLAKGLVSMVLGVVATTVLLTAGSLLFDNVDFGSPVAVAVLVLLAVAATTSIMFVIAKVARTAEQAGIAQAIVAIVLGMSGGAFFPVTATGVVGQLLQLNPVTALTRGLGITAGGGGVADLGQQVLLLLAFTGVALVAARLIPNRRDAL